MRTGESTVMTEVGLNATLPERPIARGFSHPRPANIFCGSTMPENYLLALLNMGECRAKPSLPECRAVQVLETYRRYIT